MPRNLLRTLTGPLTALAAILLLPLQAHAQGWSASYYSGRAFQTRTVEREDAAIDFVDTMPALPEGVGPSNFSVRWLGMVTPRYTETFEFILTGDDGIRLWVNGQMLVDAWYDQGATPHRGQVALQEGVPVPVMVEFYQGSGAYRSTLEWTSPQQVREVIPAERVAPLIPTTSPIPLRLYAVQTQTGEQAPQIGRVAITRFAGFDAVLDVNLQIAGDARPGEDFLAPTGNFARFAAGQSTLVYDVVVPDDPTPEPDKTVVVELLDGPGYTVEGTRSATVTIRDNDGIQGVEGGFVVGEIRHSAPVAAHYVVEAFRDAGRTDKVAGVIKVAPGIYSIGPLTESTYHLAAFEDLNKNGRADEGEEIRIHPEAVIVPPDALGVDFDFSPDDTGSPGQGGQGEGGDSNAPGSGGAANEGSGGSGNADASNRENAGNEQTPSPQTGDADDAACAQAPGRFNSGLGAVLALFAISRALVRRRPRS